jgi:hypothetical protein
MFLSFETVDSIKEVDQVKSRIELNSTFAPPPTSYNCHNSWDRAEEGSVFFACDPCGVLIFDSIANDTEVSCYSPQ